MSASSGSAALRRRTRDEFNKIYRGALQVRAGLPTAAASRREITLVYPGQLKLLVVSHTMVYNKYITKKHCDFLVNARCCER